MELFKFMAVAAAILCCLQLATARPDMSGYFVKGKSIPRVGRSYEGAEGIEDRNIRPFVITPPTGRVIPRMGRRNYDSEALYDIPKLDFYTKDYANYANLYETQLEDTPSK